MNLKGNQREKTLILFKKIEECNSVINDGIQAIQSFTNQETMFNKINGDYNNFKEKINKVRQYIDGKVMWLRHNFKLNNIHFPPPAILCPVCSILNVLNINSEAFYTCDSLLVASILRFVLFWIICATTSAKGSWYPSLDLSAFMCMPTVITLSILIILVGIPTVWWSWRIYSFVKSVDLHSYI